MFCLEYVVKEKIILKSMQDKDKAVEHVVCVCERERERVIISDS